MGRDAMTDNLGYAITDEWNAFDGTKTEFMAQLEGVTMDQRSTPAVNYDWCRTKYKMSYYCTMVRNGRLYEVHSYDDGDWHCKN